MYTIGEVQNNLVGLSHSGTLGKVRNVYNLYERAANNMLSKVKILETMRTAPLTDAVHDKLYSYAVPTDFHSLIGIYPSGERKVDEDVSRVYAEQFDRRKSIDDKQISIEGNGSSKIFRINWQTNSPKTLSTMESYNGNGTWAAVATATNVATDTVYHYSGGGSVRFDVAATGDGIDNTTLSAVDLTDEDETGDFIIPIYLKNATDAGRLTSVTFRFGNDLTANYWTGVAQTAQFDGTAFQAGWNLIKIPWNTATETGTVAPATIDSARITFTVTAAITDIRVDNILCSLGTIFDVKYYSKYLFKTAAGVLIAQPTTDTDYVICDADSINIFLFECLDEIAHQVEGEDSTFDMTQASKKLYGDPRAIDPVGRVGLYARYRAEHPAQNKKAVTNYGFKPNYNNSLRP